jgi:glycosidase
VANQWLDSSGHSAGYHGYWAEHFTKVDKHLGTLADYQQLSDRLHRRGMYLVQDIVVNHTGDYFLYDAKGWDPSDPAQGYAANLGTPPTPAPTQWPFSLNDPRRAADRQAGVYHWTPNVADYGDRNQELTWQMAGLDDLNTESPLVRRALRQSYGFWIREVGVDAYRVDTAFYVPEDFFNDFLHARDPHAPGIARVARQTGRQHFLSFGEGFGIDSAGDDRQSRKIEAYAGPGRMSGMLNFPLYGALGDAFARGKPTTELAARINTMMRVHRDPYRMPSFVDNHDVDRFLAGGDEAGLRQALLAMFTLPGIPVVYYGTEQGFTAPRAAMFAAGQGSGGRDHFDTAAPLYQLIREMAALRAGHRHLFSRGAPTPLRGTPTGPGALAWRTDHAGGSALVVFNTAPDEVLLDHLATGLPAGTVLKGLFSAQGGEVPGLVVDGAGEVSLRLPARSGLVWLAQGRSRARPLPSAGLSLAPLPTALGPDAPRLASGTAALPTPFWLVLDGDLAHATRVTPGAQGHWQGALPVGDLTRPGQAHRLVAWRDSDGAVSEVREFQATPQWVSAAELDDPADDDIGPTGRYTYPADDSFGNRHSMDLRHVSAQTDHGALRLIVTMASISKAWSPPQGFDHLALTVYIELPDEPGGSRVMPLQNASLPGDMRWHRRLRVHGWSNTLFSDQGASATLEGRVITPTAQVQTDAAQRTITLTLPASALGRKASLSGARVYLSTWDYDSGYRPLAATAQAWAFGGGDAERGAKVMDDTPVITLR